jgi:hypothetical protein
LDLRTLQLENLIIHRVPQKAAPGQPEVNPTLSDTADPQSDRVRAFFQRRIRDAIAKRGLAVEADPALDAGTIDAVRVALGDANEFAAQSRTIAQRLFNVQDRRNTEGILVIGVGVVGGSQTLVILKLEHEAGVRAEEVHLDDGSLTFRVVLHEDLLLTPKTLLFKAAVFAGDDGSFEALAADMQTTGGIADFFLARFLGCRLLENPSVTTERFFYTSEQWIGQLPDAEKRARYEIALLAEMHSGQQTIDPNAFARRALAVDEHQPYKETLQAAGLRFTQFPKDTSSIESRIRRIAYDFASGIKVVGRPEAMREHVEVEEGDDGSGSVVTITDELTRVHASG